MKNQEILEMAVKIENVEVYLDENPMQKPSYVAPDLVDEGDTDGDFQYSAPAFSRKVKDMRGNGNSYIQVDSGPIDAVVIKPFTTVLTKPELKNNDNAIPGISAPVIKEDEITQREINHVSYSGETTLPSMHPMEMESLSENELLDDPVEKPKVKLINASKLSEAISMTSNKIMDYCYIMDLYDPIKPNLRDRSMLPKGFYDKLQNVIYGSIITYCGFERNDKIVTIPDDVTTLPAFPSLVFFDRVHNDTRISFIGTDRDKRNRDATEIVSEYRKTFNDYGGIQEEWIPFFKKRLKTKLPLDPSGVEYIADFVSAEWCNILKDVTKDVNMDNEEGPSEAITTTVLQSPVEPIPQNSCINDCENCQLEECINEDFMNSNDISDQINMIDDDFTGFRIDVYNAGKGNQFDVMGEYDCIMIHPDKDVAIPIYIKGGIDNIPLDVCKIPAMGDARNNVWDFLVHFPSNQAPFISQDPSECIAGLFDKEIFDVKVVIIHVYEDGSCLMLPHYVDKDFGKVDSQEKYNRLMRLNYIIQENIGDSDISHIKRTMSDPDSFITQAEAKAIGDSDEDEDDNPDDEQSIEDYEEELMVGNTDTNGIDIVAAAMNAIQDADNNDIPSTTIPFNTEINTTYEEDKEIISHKRSGGMNEDGTFTPMSRKDRNKKRDRYR